MPKRDSNLLLYLGGLLGLVFLLKGRALANLVFSNGAVQGISFQAGTPIITFSVIAQNTNSIGITLQSIAGNAYTQDGSGQTFIGNISSFQPVHIAGNSQTPIVLQCRCSIVGAINEIISAFQYKNLTKTITINAVANVDGIQLPIPEFSIPVGI